MSEFIPAVIRELPLGVKDLPITTKKAIKRALDRSANEETQGGNKKRISQRNKGGVSSVGKK